MRNFWYAGACPISRFPFNSELKPVAPSTSSCIPPRRHSHWRFAAASYWRRATGRTTGTLPPELGSQVPQHREVVHDTAGEGGGTVWGYETEHPGAHANSAPRAPAGEKGV